MQFAKGVAEKDAEERVGERGKEFKVLSLPDCREYSQSCNLSSEPRGIGRKVYRTISITIEECGIFEQFR